MTMLLINFTLNASYKKKVRKEKKIITMCLSLYQIMIHWTIEMVLNRAISMEKQSHNLLVNVMKDRERIAEIGGEVENLRIIDEMKHTKLSEDATYQEILIYAVKREMETYEYYRDLSERFKEYEVSKLFLRLSEEERKHKNRLEREYDKHVLEEM